MNRKALRVVGSVFVGSAMLGLTLGLVHAQTSGRIPQFDPSGTPGYCSGAGGLGTDCVDSIMRQDSGSIVVDGEISVSPSPAGRFLVKSDTPATPAFDANIRPFGGNAGWLSFTEHFVADRWIVGILPGDEALHIAQGNPVANTERVTITGAGVVRAAGFNGRCENGTGPVFHPVICNQDVAETFAAVEATEPGDLVVLVNQSASTPTVARSSQPYQGLLVGVVSTNPGLVFDRGDTLLAGDNSKLITPVKTVVGLVGRVSVKVSLENGPIAVGDPLTSSSASGVAMKASRTGQIIGYALEKADQKGKIVVHLQPGYYISPKQLAQLGEMDELKAQVAKLEGDLKTVLIATVLAQRPGESDSDHVLASER